MSMNEYRAFLSVATLGSLTAAATQLGYTQSGISHLIASFESKTGLCLLVRNKKGAQLTPEGRLLLPYIQKIVDTEQALRDTVSTLLDAQTGSLRIGTISSIAINYLPQILKDFSRLHPQITITVNNGSYYDVEQALLNDATDCSFVTFPACREFSAIPLFKERMMVIVNPQNPLSKEHEITPSMLENQDFILPAEGSDYNIGYIFREAKICPQIRMIMRDDYAAVSMVRQNLGITILPELFTDLFTSDEVLGIPLKNTERTIAIAWRKAKTNSPLLQAFLNHLKSIQKWEFPLPETP